jgi:hypothetical protein
MKWIFFGLSVSLVALCLIPISINGNIYVVTNALQTINIPMTTVKVYEYAAFSKEWNKQAAYRAQHQCDKALSEAELIELSITKLSTGEPSAEEFARISNQTKKCSFTDAVLDNPAFKAAELATTDKNGQFSVRTNRFDDIILVAKGSRQNFDSTEHYVWFKTVRPGFWSFQENVELNNQANIFDKKLLEIAF